MMKLSEVDEYSDFTYLCVDLPYNTFHSNIHTKDYIGFFVVLNYNILF